MEERNLYKMKTGTIKKSFSKHTVTFWLFTTLGVLAIMLSAVISSFGAKTPSTLIMWASAYLSLVVGLAGYFFGMSLEKLRSERRSFMGLVSFFFFHAGNFLVIYGTVLKYQEGNTAHLVSLGAIFLVVSLLMMLFSISHRGNLWLRIIFYIVILVLGTSMPIGLLLSSA